MLSSGKNKCKERCSGYDYWQVKLILFLYNRFYDFINKANCIFDVSRKIAVNYSYRPIYGLKRLI